MKSQPGERRRVRRWCSWMILLAGLIALPSVSRAADPQRTGWHGETIPAGLELAENEGDYLWKKDQSLMVFVPAGNFLMGNDSGPINEKPVHQVWLDAYYIDKYEVSWRQWKLSGKPYSKVTQSRYPVPEPPSWGILDNHPMVEVSWQDAVDYAAWVGKQLPSEAQWEKAARGTEGRLYPWGDEPVTVERAVWRGHPIAEESTAPVDCCAAGASPYGVYNMAGNVYEWCQDVYDSRWYTKAPQRNPLNTEPGDYRVLRGGAFPFEVDELRSANRYRLWPEERTPYIGFRTVLPLKERNP